MKTQNYDLFKVVNPFCKWESWGLLIHFVNNRTRNKNVIMTKGI